MELKRCIGWREHNQAQPGIVAIFGRVLAMYMYITDFLKYLFQGKEKTLKEFSGICKILHKIKLQTFVQLQDRILREVNLFTMCFCLGPNNMIFRTALVCYSRLSGEGTLSSWYVWNIRQHHVGRWPMSETILTLDSLIFIPMLLVLKINK